MTTPTPNWFRVQERFKDPVEFVAAALGAQQALWERASGERSRATALDDPISAERVLREVFDGHPVRAD